MSAKPRILGLDVGDKRIGIAISDPLRYTAAGLETVKRKNMKTDVQLIAQIAARHGAVEIIIGLPLNMDGTSGEQAEKVRSFGRNLRRRADVNHFSDPKPDVAGRENRSQQRSGRSAGSSDNLATISRSRSRRRTAVSLSSDRKPDTKSGANVFNRLGLDRATMSIDDLPTKVQT
jgi:putative transcription antitermination factor YqgF